MAAAPPFAHDVAVYVGRFQPFHNGHLALLRRALAQAPTCIVVIGSAHQARTPKNPFSWVQRAQMIREALTPSERERVHLLPMRDHYHAQRWVAAVRQAVADCLAQAQPAGSARTVLVGHFKDATSTYLHDFDGWAVESVERITDVADGTQLRHALLGSTPATLDAVWGGLASQVPASTLKALREWAASPDFVRLQSEWRMLNAYHAAWAGAPYPPVFVTVDAVVRCGPRVLLIRRAHAPGAGLLAVPGGFIETRETAYQSCVRELREETHLDLDDAALARAVRANAVFDHPDRSLRGRTITHAWFFDLGQREPPAVQADDDAQAVAWMTLDEVRAAEDQFHDDHFHMLDHFLGLTSLR